MNDTAHDKLNVFLSWSGARSKAAAQALRVWLPSVLQNVRPYFTPDDIDKGSRWSDEIRMELARSDFGIIMLTRENVVSPWILFEAGALSKLERSRVAPLLLDMETAEVSGPLAQTQLTKFSREECFKLLVSLNKALGTRALDLHVLENVFDVFWPQLEKSIMEALSTSTTKGIPQKRTEREMIEEVLDRVRAIHISSAVSRSTGRLMVSSSPLDISIDELELSHRAVDCLVSENILSLQQLTEKTETELILIPNFGRSSLNEVKLLLKKLGLSLRG